MLKATYEMYFIVTFNCIVLYRGDHECNKAQR
jgi:hypothetical protein